MARRTTFFLFYLVESSEGMDLEFAGFCLSLKSTPDCLKGMICCNDKNLASKLVSAYINIR
jgi:hypothetical protein